MDPGIDVPRARRIAQAAIEVLGQEGAEGLTHRAVDRQADLPEGSTSNVFRTRAALVGAVCQLLTERDLDQLRREAAKLAGRPKVTTANAASALVGIVERWAGDEALYTCARLELFLAARRNPEIAENLAPARAAFRDFTSGWLEGVSEGGAAHVGSLMALIEGLTMIQLLHPASRLSRAELRAEIMLLLRAIAG